MSRRTACALLVILLGACTQEWRTEEPVRPATYAPAGVRSEASVGRLARLLVLPARIHMAPDLASEPDSQPRAAEMATGLQKQVMDYLVEEKGYEARGEEVPLPSTEPASIRAAGARHSVDGIVVVERWLRKPWTTADILANLAMLNAPLLKAMREPYFRVSIYESASGRLVWKGELSGMHPEHPVPQISYVSLTSALGNLENAVPRQLRR